MARTSTSIRAEHLGVEPICKELPVSPSTYYECRAREDDPEPACLIEQSVTGRYLELDDQAGLGGELPGLWRPQGLAAA